MLSVSPPAAQGTIILIGRSGYDEAANPWGSLDSSTTAAAARIFFTTHLPSNGLSVPRPFDDERAVPPARCSRDDLRFDSLCQPSPSVDRFSGSAAGERRDGDSVPLTRYIIPRAAPSGNLAAGAALTRARSGQSSIVSPSRSA